MILLSAITQVNNFDNPEKNLTELKNDAKEILLKISSLLVEKSDNGLLYLRPDWIDCIKEIETRNHSAIYATSCEFTVRIFENHEFSFTIFGDINQSIEVFSISMPALLVKDEMKLPVVLLTSVGI